MKALLAGIYALVLLAGAFLVLHRTDSADSLLTASRDLPFNHLVQIDDLTIPLWYVPPLSQSGPKPADAIGRYTPGNIQAGQAIRIADLMLTPTIGPGNETIRILHPVDTALVKSHLINAGADVRLCAGNTSLLDRARVVAVICPKAAVPCSAVLDVRPADIANFATPLASQATLVLSTTACR